MSFLLSACAIGPLVGGETARTVGDGKHELVVGGGQQPYSLKWNHGFSKDFDLGLQIESVSMGVRAKYALTQQASSGLSLALALGAGSSIGGQHTYGDFLVSYLTGVFEPYGTFRYTAIKTDPVELRNENTGDVDLAVDSTKYNYGLGILGVRFWLTPKWHLSVEGSKIFAVDSSVTIQAPVMYGLHLGYRF